MRLPRYNLRPCALIGRHSFGTPNLSLSTKAHAKVSRISNLLRECEFKGGISGSRMFNKHDGSHQADVS